MSDTFNEAVRLRRLVMSLAMIADDQQALIGRNPATDREIRRALRMIRRPIHSDPLAIVRDAAALAIAAGYTPDQICQSLTMPSAREK
jgi:ABC-type amino acid transport system permease subunit